MMTMPVRRKHPLTNGMRICRSRTARFCASVTLGIVLTGSAQAQNGIDPSGFIPVAIFGTDDRVPVPQRYQKLQESIGVLFNLRAKTVCTAFCVADAMIATAGHCLYRQDAAAKDKAAPPRLADFWFARGYDTTRDYARIAGYAGGAAAQNVLAGSQKLNLTPPIDATSDWALIRVARPVCAKHALPVEPLTMAEVQSRADAKQVFQIAYHRDFTQWRPAYSKPCEVKRSFNGADWPIISKDFSNPEQLLLHTCDTGGASSGSPMLVDTPSGPKVIGINVGTYVQSRVLTQNGQTIQRLKPETIANTGVAAAVFADKLEAFKTAIILTTTTQLRELQVRLLLRQLYTGPADGTYGPALKTSIETFERQTKRPVTGLATTELLRLLQDETSNIPSSTKGGVKVP
jgi:Putative peptidoglycan binding domain/Trypsin